MQLIHETTTLLTTVKNMKMTSNNPIKEALTDNFDVKEKLSDAPLLLMNPVASGDNVATRLTSAHKIKEELPPLIPCCEGRELQINEDLARSGLSAISVKHDNVIECWSLSRACDKFQVPAGLVKHRNSFRCLHRPDLKRVSYLRRMTSDELETLFRGYADLPWRSSKNENCDDRSRIKPPPTENTGQNLSQDNDGNGGIPLRAITETRSGSEDVPAGKKLHGAQARLYTSVLASAKGGDNLDGITANEEYDTRVPEISLHEDEVQLTEELQIILPPRCDDITADSSKTSSSQA